MSPYLNIIDVTKRVTPDRQIEVIQITMNGLSAFEITSFKTIFNPRATIAINIHNVVITFIIFISNEGIGTNYTDIGFVYNETTGVLTISSVIDNLIKGAAGQAIQNMNLMFNFDETDGLILAPLYI